MNQVEIFTKLKQIVAIADELEAEGAMMHSDARDLRSIARVLRDSVIFKPAEIVHPICPACGGVMADFGEPDSSARHTRPRFVCTNKECFKKLVGRGGRGNFKKDQFEDSKFRTGLWNVADLKNAIQYHEAELGGKTKTLEDGWQNREQFQ